jgi:hypothetical protein
MIPMIISGGQTGACRAALDVALRFNIPHGGWIPKGRKSEGRPILDKYQLQELSTSGYRARSAQNVRYSDGTVIFSRGEPTGEIRYTRMIALQFQKHLLHIDFNKIAAKEAAVLILTWIRFQNIKTVNVTGPSASKDGRIYADVYRTLEMAYRMRKVERLKSGKQPET